MNFDIFGYSKDYYFNGKYIGNIVLKQQDRDVMGYQGRATEILDRDTLLKKKVYKAGTKVTTELVMLCGRKKTL